MKERLRAILEELELINCDIQNGCIDPSALKCFKDSDDSDTVSLMEESDRLLTEAAGLIEQLFYMMKEE